MIQESKERTAKIELERANIEVERAKIEAEREERRLILEKERADQDHKNTIE